jgi:TIR domain/Tetratricopeptide repeat/NB-ARC domain
MAQLEDTGSSIFISYASPVDVFWATWIGAALESAGQSVQLQEWDSLPGQNFATWINDRLTDSTTVIAVYSHAYFKSHWCLRECMAALERNVLVPVRVEECSPPPIIGTINYIDIYGISEEKARTRLLRAAGLDRAARTPISDFGSDVRSETMPPFPGHLPGTWNLRRRSRYFTGRDDELTQLRRHMNSDSLMPAVWVLHGEGGVGKTTLSIEYAYRHSREYEVVWFIPAEDLTVASERLVGLAARLGLNTTSVSATGAVAELFDYLANRSRWLLIFDNSDEPREIIQLLPSGGNGHILITSRNPSWSELAGTVAIERLSLAAAVELVRLRLPTVGMDEASQLADALVCLPLALTHALGTLEQTGMSVDEYLELFKSKAANLLAGDIPIGYPVSLAASWQISLQRLGDADPLALVVIRIASFFSPEPIPLELLRPESEHDPTETFVQGSRLDLRRSVGQIRRYGLARVDGNALHIHRLGQLIIRAQLTENETKEYSSFAERRLASTRPGDPRDPTTWRIYSGVLPHVMAIDVDECGNRDILTLSLDCIEYLARRGNLVMSRRLAESNYRKLSARFGRDDVLSLRAAHVLSLNLRWLGRYPAARTLHDDTLARQSELLGDDHPDTLLSANNLGIVLRKLGEYEFARRIGEDVLARRRRVLGDDHPETLRSSNSLVILLGEIGEYATSRSLGEDTLARRRRILGDDHPDTLHSADSLAAILSHLGDYRTAQALGEDTLARRRRILGDDHPDTHDSVSHVAKGYRNVDGE